MRVLILGTDTPLGQALTEWLQQLGRHELVTMSRSACRWKSERQAKKEVRRAACDILVDLRIEAAVDGSEVLFIAVGTPQGEDGSADLRHVLAVAAAIGATSREIVFTSGATESNNLAVRGLAERRRRRGALRILNRRVARLRDRASP